MAVRGAPFWLLLVCACALHTAAAITSASPQWKTTLSFTAPQPGAQLPIQDGEGATYGLLFDAGSSGTRLGIFTWPKRVFSTYPVDVTIPLAKVYYSDRFQPGIDQPAGRQYLNVLLNNARAFLNATSEQMATYPIFLTATAGLRILNETARNSALAQVRTIFAASGFMFQPSWARVISGEEEGVYGWLAVNFLAGTLINNTGSAPQLPSTTFGALDLGGASTQITYIPPAPITPIANLYVSQLTTTLVAPVYTHSFLYYGQNEAAVRAHDMVLQIAAANGATITAGGVYNHPCYLSGTPLLHTNFTSQAYGGKQVYFNGTGDFAGCRAVMDALMLKSTQCLTDPKPVYPATTAPAANVSTSVPFSLPSALPAPALINPAQAGSTCSINGVYQPPVSQPTGNVSFVAFSSFVYSSAFLGLSSNATVQQWAANATLLCGTPYATIWARYRNTSFATFLPFYCTYSSYIVSLLATGYGLPTDSTFVHVARSSMSYADGAMLAGVNHLALQLQLQNATDDEELRGYKITTVVLASWLCLTFLIACVWFVRSRRCKFPMRTKTRVMGDEFASDWQTTNALNSLNRVA